MVWYISLLQYPVIIILLQVSVACAISGADSDGFPIIPQDGSGTGFSIWNGSIIDSVREDIIPSVLIYTNLNAYSLISRDLAGMKTENSLSFSIPVNQDHTSQPETVFGFPFDLSDMALFGGAVLTPKVSGTYVFQVDYTGYVATLDVFDWGSLCVLDDDDDEQGTAYLYKYISHDKAESPDYTSQIIKSVNLTTGQSYMLGFMYTSLFNETYHNTQQYASLNISMTLPSGEVVTDFTDYSNSKSNLTEPSTCQYQDVQTSTTTWTGSYITTIISTSTITPVSTATGTAGLEIVEEIYYINVPTSVSSSQYSSTASSSEFSSSVIELSSITSSSKLSASVSLSDSYSTTSSEQESFSTSLQESSFTSSAGSSSLSEQSSVPVSSLGTSTSDLSTSVVATLEPSSIITAVTIPSSPAVSYNTSLVSSVPNRNVVSTDGSSSERVASATLSSSSVSQTSQPFSESGFTASRTLPQTDLSDQGLRHSTVNDESRTNAVHSTNSLNIEHFGNTTRTVGYSATQWPQDVVATETYTNEYGYTITTVVPCKLSNNPSVNTSHNLASSNSMPVSVVTPVDGAPTITGQKPDMLGANDETTTIDLDNHTDVTVAPTVSGHTTTVVSNGEQLATASFAPTGSNMQRATTASTTPTAILLSLQSDNGVQQQHVSTLMRIFVALTCLVLL